MSILLEETLERLRSVLPNDEKYTDEELDATAYFLTTTTLLPAGILGVADVDAFTIGVTANFLANGLLPQLIAYGAIDPVAIREFVRKVQAGEITPEEFSDMAKV